jgi:hypothetical protein
MFISKGIREVLIRSEIRTTELFIDESAQVAAIHFFPFIYHYDQIQKLVLLGDPNQLPPYGTMFKAKKNNMQTLGSIGLNSIP